MKGKGRYDFYNRAWGRGGNISSILTVVDVFVRYFPVYSVGNWYQQATAALCGVHFVAPVGVK